MAESLHTGRLVSFTLRDVPPEIRRRRGRALLDAAADNMDVFAGLQIHKAIEDPSDRVYRITAAAYYAAAIGDPPRS